MHSYWQHRRPSESQREKWAFMKAVSLGRVSQVKRMLAQGADINMVEGVDEKGPVRTPLARSLLENYAVLSQFLLGHPSLDINEQDDYGQTALMLCMLHDKIPYFETLLARPDIEVNLQCQAEEEGYNRGIWVHNGRTALHLAVVHKKTDCVRLLLEHPKIMVHIEDKDGKTALDLVETDEIRALFRDYDKARQEEEKSNAAPTLTLSSLERQIEELKLENASLKNENENLKAEIAKLKN